MLKLCVYIYIYFGSKDIPFTTYDIPFNSFYKLSHETLLFVNNGRIKARSFNVLEVKTIGRWWMPKEK
jgi:hypothetical protein